MTLKKGGEYSFGSFRKRIPNLPDGSEENHKDLIKEVVLITSSQLTV